MHKQINKIPDCESCPRFELDKFSLRELSPINKRIIEIWNLVSNQFRIDGDGFPYCIDLNVVIPLLEKDSILSKNNKIFKYAIYAINYILFNEIYGKDIKREKEKLKRELESKKNIPGGRL